MNRRGFKVNNLFVQFSRFITFKNIKFVMALSTLVSAQFCTGASILYRIKHQQFLPVVITV
jgi:hypothetical protein